LARNRGAVDIHLESRDGAQVKTGGVAGMRRDNLDSTDQAPFCEKFSESEIGVRFQHPIPSVEIGQVNMPESANSRLEPTFIWQ
jgi:hypothetical protein